MIVIDGSIGEGGGQIIRTSLALSCFTGTPVKIINIRAKRKQPGLRPQHFSVVNALAELFNAEVKGNFVGSKELYFSPEKFSGIDDYEVNVGTAGSVTLILQALLLALHEHNLRLTLLGGTEVRWSPTIDYFDNVIRPAFESFGFRFDLRILRRGYYPEGGGKVIVNLEGSVFSPFDFLEKDDSREVQGVSVCCSLPYSVAERQAKAAEQLLRESGYELNIRYFVGDGNKGSSCTLWQGFVGADALGEKGKPAEEVGREAAVKFLEESQAVVDSHLADNLIPYMAMITSATKESCSFATSKVSNHCHTNMIISQKFFDNVEFEVVKGKVISRVK